LDNDLKLFRVIIIEPKKEPKVKVIDTPITYRVLCAMFGPSYGASFMPTMPQYRIYYSYRVSPIDVTKLNSRAIIVKQPIFLERTSLNCNDITLIMKHIEENKPRVAEPA